MSDEKLWREEGPKALLEFLSSATGEDYDAAVYDTKFDFDTSDMDAVKYVASVAMAKAQPILMDWKKKEYWETFEYPLPAGGSVAKHDSDDGNEAVCKLREGRIYRETHTEGPCLYVPDATQYCDVIHNALYKREVPYEDMSDSEKAVKRREESRSKFRYECLPQILAMLLVLFCIIIVIHKCAS